MTEVTERRRGTEGRDSEVKCFDKSGLLVTGGPVIEVSGVVVEVDRTESLGEPGTSTEGGRTYTMRDIKDTITL